MIKFTKMHGLGNDFVIIDTRNQAVSKLLGCVSALCDRNFGVGCDLLVLLETSENADIFARFYNADGSESAACGNATRCVADIIMSETGTFSATIETGRGILPVHRADERNVTVDMGAPIEVNTDLPLDGKPVAVNMGNPHCVFFVDKLVDVAVDKMGSAIENNALFPNKTNVEYVEITGENQLRQKTWERGVGETLACGSGACAVAVAAVTKGLTDRTVDIELDGGSLNIEWRESDGHVLMTGPYAYVFEGVLSDDLRS